MFLMPASRARPRLKGILPAASLLPCGRLSFVSATALKFSPLNGGVIRINGRLYQIPTTGIAGLANTSIFLNGVSGQNLSVSTLYYVYAFDYQGVVTADFSTTTHTTSTAVGNIGTEIKTGDNTRSLIGLAYANASGQFSDSLTQRFVLSWFNRRGIGTQNQFTANRALTTGAAWVEINTEVRIEFLTWADEQVNATFAGGMFINTAADQMYLAIDFDGTTPPPDIGTFVCQGSNTIIFSVGMSGNVSGLAEGYHYATVMSFQLTGSGGGAVTGTVNQARRSGLTIGIRG